MDILIEKTPDLIQKFGIIGREMVEKTGIQGHKRKSLKISIKD